MIFKCNVAFLDIKNKEGIFLDEYNLIKWAKEAVNHKENGYNLYWIGIGKDDFLFDANVEFRKMLDDINFKYTYKETEGGHTWRNWRIYLTEFLPLLFK